MVEHRKWDFLVECHLEESWTTGGFNYIAAGLRIGYHHSVDMDRKSWPGTYHIPAWLFLCPKEGLEQYDSSERRMGVE